MTRDEFRNALRTLVWSATGWSPGTIATDLPLEVVCEELEALIANLRKFEVLCEEVADRIARTPA